MKEMIEIYENAFILHLQEKEMIFLTFLTLAS